jgi:hypothetical protein
LNIYFCTWRHIQSARVILWWLCAIPILFSIWSTMLFCFCKSGSFYSRYWCCEHSSSLWFTYFIRFPSLGEKDTT